jgi:hypothetical protein
MQLHLNRIYDAETQGYHRKAGQKGTQFLFVSSNLSRLKRVSKLNNG